MKAMIAKELREGLKWAALVLVVLGICTFVIFAANRLEEVLMYWVADCAAATTAGAAAGGLLLGIMSTALEARADRWAFLVHRPLSRTAIFLGKAIAGLALLYLAAGIPFAASVAWCEASDFWAAPFRIELAVPWAIDLLAGGVYFFTGMVIGLRRARWYGSKVLPLGFPLLATALTWAVSELWMAVLVVLAGLAISAAAAWGTFLAGGEHKPQPPAARAAVALHVFLGACLVAGLVLGLLVFVAGELVLPREKFPSSAGAEPLFLRDGSVVLSTWQPDHTLTLTDPQGKILSTYRDYAAFRKAIPDEERINSSLFLRYWRRTPFCFKGYRSPARLYRVVAHTGAGVWCLSVREGLLRGYDLEKKRPVGYLGPGGFAPPDASLPAPFPGTLCEEEFFAYGTLAFSGGVFAPDFAERKAPAVFTPQAGERVLSVARIMGRHWADAHGWVVEAIAVLTEKSVRVVEPDGTGALAAVTLPFDPQSLEYLRVGFWKSTRRVFAQVRVGAASPEQVYVFEPEGALVTRFEVPEYPAPARQILSRLERVTAVLGGPVWVLGNKIALAWIREGLSAFPLGRIWLFLLLPSVLCAAVALAVARRESMRCGRALAWIAAAFLLGVPGLLTLLSLSPRSALVRCPACSARRPGEGDLCPRCAAPFPAPARDGTEVFA